MRATGGVFTSRLVHDICQGLYAKSAVKKNNSVVTISVPPICDHANGDRPIESLAIELCATKFDSTMLKNLMLKMLKRERKKVSRNILSNVR